MSDETSLDITGVGKLAKAIPEKVWVQIVDTACTTFRQVIAPVTALTGGVGRLIDAKFESLAAAQKVLAAETFTRASEKVRTSKKPLAANVNARILIEVMDKSSAETDPLLRELWANLLAEEFVSGEVHPEFPKILVRLSPRDAQTLARIAQQSNSKEVLAKLRINSLLGTFSMFGVKLKFEQSGSFIHEHLRNLDLIQRDGGAWALTLTGAEFLRNVGGDLADPGSD